MVGEYLSAMWKLYVQDLLTQPTTSSTHAVCDFMQRSQRTSRAAWIRLFRKGMRLAAREVEVELGSGLDDVMVLGLDGLFGRVWNGILNEVLVERLHKRAKTEKD